MDDKAVEKSGSVLETEPDRSNEINVKYIFRDLNKKMVEEWKTAFSEYREEGSKNFVHISCGDIFEGAPTCDALVSPANSFGFMDGGIDMVYTRHFGWQMQKRLQRVIKEKYSGEIVVGNAVIIPSYETEPKSEDLNPNCNGGKPIKYLISAPTMRVPENVENTVNAYLAFRAVILAVQEHNKKPDVEPITSVMCPGLGTCVGEMPKKRCACQMLKAYEVFHAGLHKEFLQPTNIIYCTCDNEDMKSF